MRTHTEKKKQRKLRPKVGNPAWARTSNGPAALKAGWKKGLGKNKGGKAGLATFRDA